jgi:hypothetical protein
MPATTDTPLFDLTAAEMMKNDGAASALASDRAWPWREHAMAALLDLADSGRAFTSDDLIAQVGLPDMYGRNNAVGALFISAAKQGLIVKTGHYVKARRAASHARMLALWAGNPDRV